MEEHATRQKVKVCFAALFKDCFRTCVCVSHPQIKVSVSSSGDCLRSYRPDIRKGRYNTIVLHVKTTTPDNLLFYLGSAKYVRVTSLPAISRF